MAILFASGWCVAHIPVLNQFRYAFKWWFTVPPLLFYLAALTPKLSSSSLPIRLVDASLLTTAVTIGVLTLRFVWPIGSLDVNSKLDPRTGRDLPPGMPFRDQPDHRLPATAPAEPDGFRELAEKIDLTNYRFMPAFAGAGFDAWLWRAYHTNQRFVDRHLCSNVAVRVRAYTPIGYHIGLRPSVAKVLEPLPRSPMFNLGVPSWLVWEILRFPIPDELRHLSDADAEDALIGKRFVQPSPTGGPPFEIELAAGRRVIGVDELHTRFWQVFGGKVFVNGGGWGDFRAWTEQLGEAGVRYLVFRTEQLDDAMAYHSKPERWWPHPDRGPNLGAVIRTREFSAVELPTARPIVAGPNGESLPFRPSANGVSITLPTGIDGLVKLRFNPEPGFRAYLFDATGRRQRTTLVAESDGAMVVHVPAGSWTRLEVRVRDRRIWAAVGLNLFAVLVIAGVRGLVLKSFHSTSEYEMIRSTLAKVLRSSPFARDPITTGCPHANPPSVNHLVPGSEGGRSDVGSG